MVNIKDIVKESARVYTRTCSIKSLKAVPKRYETVRNGPDFPYEIVHYLEGVPENHITYF